MTWATILLCGPHEYVPIKDAEAALAAEMHDKELALGAAEATRQEWQQACEYAERERDEAYETLRWVAADDSIKPDGYVHRNIEAASKQFKLARQAEKKEDE